MPFSRQLEKIKQGKLWRFFGGIRPLERKATTSSPIEELAIPSLITLPLDRHLGPGGQILVRVGDYVKAGQPLTLPGGKRNVPLHASTSGHVTGIGMQLLPHPSGYLGRCITIKPDGLDAKVMDQPMTDWQERTPHELLERIRLFGVEGLGGAQFQTAAKIGAALEESNGDCNIFIVNGAECEPVATCDDRLMQERAADIAQGIEVVRRILDPKAIIVAIEDNKPKALEAMKAAVAPDVMVRKIPTLYPSGAARNLIKICTGIEIPYNAHTSECGIVVDNVETVFAIKQAVVDGIPLIKRVVTVDGMTLGRSGNALVRLGTSVRFVLNAYKLNPERRQRIILGGPFMGFTLPSIDVPITKSCTCVFAPSSKEVELQPEEMNCIRCGRCARVCPSRLVPYQLYALSKTGQHKTTKKCGMMDCTECGCCAYVCPSKIALTNQFRKEKAILRILDDNQRRNLRAQERMAERNERLKKEEEARQKRRAAALARIEADKNASPEELQARRAQAVALARQRAAAKRGQINNPALSPNALADAQSAGLLANEKGARNAASDLMAQTKDGALVAAMLAQGGTSAMIQDLGVDTAARISQQTLGNFEDGSYPLSDNQDGNLSGNLNTDAITATAEGQGENQPEKLPEKLPYYLRKAARPKHAVPLEHWNAVPEHMQDLAIVENPPAQGQKIQTGKSQPKRYFGVTSTRLISKLHLPKKLFRKDLTLEQIEQIEKAEQDAEMQAVQPQIKTKNMFGLPISSQPPLPGMKAQRAQSSAIQSGVINSGALQSTALSEQNAAGSASTVSSELSAQLAQAAQVASTTEDTTQDLSIMISNGITVTSEALQSKSTVVTPNSKGLPSAAVEHSTAQTAGQVNHSSAQTAVNEQTTKVQPLTAMNIGKHMQAQRKLSEHKHNVNLGNQWTAGDTWETEDTSNSTASISTTSSSQTATVNIDHEDHMTGHKFTYGNERLEDKPLDVRHLQANVGGVKVDISIAHADNLQQAEYLANMHPALQSSNNAVNTANLANAVNTTHAANVDTDSKVASQPSAAQVKEDGALGNNAQTNSATVNTSDNAAANTTSHATLASRTAPHKIKQQRYGNWALPQKPASRWVAPGSEKDQ